VTALEFRITESESFGFGARSCCENLIPHGEHILLITNGYEWKCERIIVFSSLVLFRLGPPFVHSR
jgi:hypothetical protein